MQLLLQRMDRRGPACCRLDRLRCLDRGRGDVGGGGRRRDDVADRPGRQDAVDGEERRRGRQGGGGAARSRGNRGLAIPRVPRMPRRSIPRGTDRTPGERRPFVATPGVGRLARVVVVASRRRRRDVILIARIGRVAVQIAVVVAVAGYTGTIVQRTRRLRHGRA